MVSTEILRFIFIVPDWMSNGWVLSFQFPNDQLNHQLIKLCCIVCDVVIIIIRRTFIKRHKSRNIHSEALYMSIYTRVVELQY